MNLKVERSTGQEGEIGGPTGPLLFCQESFSRGASSIWASLADAFQVVVRDSDLNEVDLRAAGDGTEIQDEDRPVVFFPVCGAPELYDALARGDKEILSLDLSAECAEPAARFAAYASGHAGG